MITLSYQAMVDNKENSGEILLKHKLQLLAEIGRPMAGLCQGLLTSLTKLLASIATP